MKRTGTGLVRRECCPACGETAGSSLISLPYDDAPISTYLSEFYDGRLDTSGVVGARYELVGCPSCGLVYQRMAPDDALLEHLYGHAALADADATAERRGLEVRVAYAHDVERMLRHFARPPHEVAVLDFGSGTGSWLTMAAAFGCKTSGSELTSDALDRLERVGHAAYRPEELPGGHFHFINTEQVVEHLVDPFETVQRLADALRPGGLLRISVPNGSDIRDRLVHQDWSAPKGSARSLNAVAPLEHLNCFDGPSLTTLGRRAGLTPFRYPLRAELHQHARLRHAVGALRSRVRCRPGTLQVFRRA